MPHRALRRRRGTLLCDVTRDGRGQRRDLCNGEKGRGPTPAPCDVFLKTDQGCSLGSPGQASGGDEHRLCGAFAPLGGASCPPEISSSQAPGCSSCRRGFVGGTFSLQLLPRAGQDWLSGSAQAGPHHFAGFLSMPLGSGARVGPHNLRLQEVLVRKGWSLPALLGGLALSLVAGQGPTPQPPWDQCLVRWRGAPPPSVLCLILGKAGGLGSAP